jgi:ATP-binding cassette, subfamily B, bacterial HlyB/CyaB
LGKAGEGNVLVQSPLVPRPQLMTQAELEAVWDGRIVLVARRAGLVDLARRFDITWFLGAIVKYRGLLGEVFVASFFLQLFALAPPLIFQVVIDKVLVHRSMSTLDLLIIAFSAIAIFETVLGALRTYIFAHTTNRIDVELGARLFRHLLALPIAYFQARRVGDSVARVRELENIRNFLTGSALTLVIDLFFTFVFLAVMFVYSSLLTWIIIASFPFYIAVSAVATPMFRQRLDEKFKRSAENQAFLVEAVTGVETLKSMAVEPQMQRRWEEQLAGYVTASFRVTSLGNVASQGVQLVSKLATALTLYFGARLVIDGSLSVGELVAFNMLSGRVSQPVLRLAQIWQDFHQARLSVARLGDILNTSPEQTYNTSRSTLPAVTGSVRFEHVTFRYRVDGSEILRDIDFDVPAGQIVGIVGPSGSGKSTVAKLVQRLYVPESGKVLVDGIDLAVVDPAWLRRQIGVVLQENVLFNASVRANIALADPAMAMERVIAAATLAGAHDFILELPEGYDTIVGERGSSLSGGQRQRIAIARALVANPRILIFDEATSSLDYESEQIIQNNMRKIVEGRTALIIAHRLSTVRRANRIITIERGRIVEDGTHDELIRSGGRYAMLYRLQAGIHEVG